MKIKDIFEARLPDLDYQQDGDSVKVKLHSYKSQVYTKLAQKTERIKALKTELETLESEVKQSAREDVADLFDATDAVNTRVVETLQFMFTLSKDPKATETPQYKKILEELSQHLLPEQIAVMEALKKQFVTVTQKSPSLKISKITESVATDFFAKFKRVVLQWTRGYDQQLDKLKKLAAEV